MGLGDAALVKDNHVAAAGGIAAAIRAVRGAAPGLPLEVECDCLDQVREALAEGAGLILLDNMGLADLRAAVALARRYPAVRLEASGDCGWRRPGRWRRRAWTSSRSAR
jgi:nicotinate-nucleotide pyrophosphorylase (carboxylating)